MTLSGDRFPMDRCTAVQGIRDIFARSPLLRDAVLSDPRMNPDGTATIEVRWDQGPTVFRVVATTTGEAYALLHELAASTVEAVRRPAAWQGCGAAAAGVGAPSRSRQARMVLIPERHETDVTPPPCTGALRTRSGRLAKGKIRGRYCTFRVATQRERRDRPFTEFVDERARCCLCHPLILSAPSIVRVLYCPFRYLRLQ